MEKIHIPSDVDSEDLLPSVEEILHLSRKKFGPKFTRREFFRITAALASIGTYAGVKRIHDLEFGDWRDYAKPKQYYMAQAMQFQKKFEFGPYPDFEKHPNPWNDVDTLKEAAGGIEDKIGVFFNLEWVDVESYPGKLDEFLRLINYIHNERGSTPLISIHMGVQPNKKHPFHPENIQWMVHHIEMLFRILDQYCPFTVDIRPFYEGDIHQRFGFVYGPADNFNGIAHQIGFKKIIRIFAQYKWQSAYMRNIAFCPSIWNDFSPYYIYPENGLYYFDSIGVDGYDIFPGKLSTWIDLDVSFDVWIQILLCYLIGKRSPEEVFGPSLRRMRQLTEDGIPMYIYELGSKDGDAEWIDFAFWYLAAHGGQGAFPFIYDKHYQIEAQGKFYEGPWNKIVSFADKFGKSIITLNNRALDA